MSVDELREYGLTEMDDAEIRRFLSNQRVGVLGLPGTDRNRISSRCRSGTTATRGCISRISSGPVARRKR